jgi:hypothetical protein
VSNLPGDLRVPTTADLATIQAPAGTCIYVDSEGCSYESLYVNAQTGDISGPVDANTNIWRKRAGTLSVTLPDGTSATAVSIAGNIRVEMVGTTARITANPTHVYGNTDIASKLMRSVQNDELIHLVAVGDSRTYNLIGNPLASAFWTCIHEMPIVGIDVQMNGIANEGCWASPTVYTIANPPAAVSTPLGNLGTIAPMSLYEATMLGGTVPTAHDLINRLTYGTYDTAVETALAPVTKAGRTFKLTGVVRATPDGVTTSDIYGAIVHTTANVATSPKINAYAATEEYRKFTATLAANFDWAAHPSVAISFNLTQGLVTVTNKRIYFCDCWIQSGENGIIVHDWSGPQRSVLHHLDDTIMGDELYSELVPQMYDGTTIYWIDLGTNDSAHWADHEANMLALIAKVRQYDANAQILLTTAYPVGDLVHHDIELIPGVSPFRREVALAIAASDPNVLLIDTYSAVPGWTKAVALGYSSTDPLHYLEPGNKNFVQTLGRLLAQAAGIGALLDEDVVVVPPTDLETLNAALVATGLTFVGDWDPADATLDGSDVVSITGAVGGVLAEYNADHPMQVTTIADRVAVQAIDEPESVHALRAAGVSARTIVLVAEMPTLPDTARAEYIADFLGGYDCLALSINSSSLYNSANGFTRKIDGVVSLGPMTTGQIVVLEVSSANVLSTGWFGSGGAGLQTFKGKIGRMFMITEQPTEEQSAALSESLLAYYS